MKLDDRAIRSIRFPGAGGGYYEVGKGGVERISVEYVAGQMSDVPWFTVWVNGETWCRCNAAMIEEVEYEE